MKNEQKYNVLCLFVLFEYKVMHIDRIKQISLCCSFDRELFSAHGITLKPIYVRKQNRFFFFMIVVRTRKHSLRSHQNIEQDENDTNLNCKFDRLYFYQIALCVRFCTSPVPTKYFSFSTVYRIDVKQSRFVFVSLSFSVFFFAVINVLYCIVAIKHY